jgi:hypothetical protein
MQSTLAQSGGAPGDDWSNWRHRSFQITADAIGRANSRPCDLRHSFVSLLIAADPAGAPGRWSTLRGRDEDPVPLVAADHGVSARTLCRR